MRLGQNTHVKAVEGNPVEGKQSQVQTKESGTPHLYC